MSYRTSEQLQIETSNAKAVSIFLIAEHFGYQLNKKGNYCFANGTNNHLAFFIKTNSFYDYYEKK